MNAQQLLDERLSALATTLEGLDEKHLEELTPVRKALERIAVKPGQKRFCEAVTDLAEAVIQVRRTSKHPKLKALPIPPYDLWLPFKALDVRSNDCQDIVAPPLWNERIDTISSLLNRKGTTSDDS